MASNDILYEEDTVFYSLLYSGVTVVFAMTVLSKFASKDCRLGFRSILSLGMLFLGEPLCQFLLKGPQGLAVFALGCVFVYIILPPGHLPANNKAVLVTGCDSGFGHAIAKKLDSLGMVVFAGCLSNTSPGAISLQETCSRRITVIELDITSREQVDKAFTIVENELHNRGLTEEGLWGLVNNAGVAYIGDIEHTPEAIFHKTIDVNLLGTVRVTKSFLPLVKKSKGRIVNMSSLGGKIASQYFAAYVASKFAIEGYSDVLRLETTTSKICVALIEPSGFYTSNLTPSRLESCKQEMLKSLPPEQKTSEVEKNLCALYKGLEAFSKRFPKDLSPVVRSTCSALLSKNPRYRYPCGRGAETILTLLYFLPTWIRDKVCLMISIKKLEI